MQGTRIDDPVACRRQIRRLRARVAYGLAGVTAAGGGALAGGIPTYITQRELEKEHEREAKLSKDKRKKKEKRKRKGKLVGLQMMIS